MLVNDILKSDTKGLTENKENIVINNNKFVPIDPELSLQGKKGS